tara:strand:+ start:5695 stop:6912 length:1218 start_codon:yes stop_codon:yes gene_type:complete
MSLQQLLQGYSQQINARVEHGQAVQDDVQDRKASTMEQHFEKAQAILEAGGGQVTGVSLAYHTGRKLYKKYQEKYDKKTKPGESEDTPEETNKPTQRPTEGDEPTSDSMPSEARPAPVERAPPSEKSSLDTIDEEDEDADAAGDDAGQPTSSAADDAANADAPAADAAPPAADAAPPAADSASAPSADAAPDPLDASTAGEDTGSDAFDAAMARPAPVTAQPPAQADAPATDAPTDAPSTSVGGQDIKTAPDAPPDAPGMGDSIPGGADRPPVAAGEADTGADDLLSAARSATNKLTGEATSQLGDKAGNIAGQIGKKIGIAAGEDAGESAAFLTTEGVLDALGPLSAVGGVIMGLVGLFKSLFHKDDTDKPVVPKPDATTVVTSASGIDPNALASSTPVVGTVL